MVSLWGKEDRVSSLPLLPFLRQVWFAMQLVSKCPN